jgi:tetratricopeptide (TPR) repeat protein
LELGLSTAAPAPESCSPPDPPSARLFGDYELLEEIGRGGMGVIYKARQLSLNRLVALKMVGVGEFASPTMVHRFHLEAEAAANLHHPNIVPIYETGAHHGQHFFSMKLIDGAGVDRFLTKTGFYFRHSPGADDSPPRARQEQIARLIAKVARAVHHAHQHGVLHRDLKPGNVLLDRQGEPHLTDFGVAKVLGEADSALTATGAIVGTPSYMAPEQAAGHSKRTTTAADIYSLGAVLYAMLTGRPPFRADTAVATLRQVIELEPTPPTTFNDALDRDLATICLKCLEKEPPRRYPSASALADDLDRWLRHEPILARPATSVDRARKWVRRNPVVAALVTALGLALVVGFSAVLWKQRQTERAYRQVAATLHQSLDIILKQLTLMTDDRRQTGADVYTLRVELAESSARLLDDFSRQDSLAPIYDLRRAAAYHTIAEAQNTLARNAEAITNALKARNLYQSLATRRIGLPASAVQQAACSRLLGKVLRFSGRLIEAERFHRESIDICERLVSESPADPTAHHQLAGNRGAFANLLFEVGRSPEARALYRAAVAGLQTALALAPHDTDGQRELVRTVRNLETYLVRWPDEGDAAERTNQLRRALPAARQLAREQTPLPDDLANLASLLCLLGEQQRRLGAHAEAEQSLQESLRLWNQLVADFPIVPKYQMGQAAIHECLGRLWMTQNRMDAAQPFIEKAVGMLHQRLKWFPKEFEAMQYLAQTHAGNAALHQSAGRRQSARDSIHAAISWNEAALKLRPALPRLRADSAAALHQSGRFFLDDGQHQKAEADLRQSQQLWQALADEFSTSFDYRLGLADAWASLAEALTELDRANDAAQALNASEILCDRLASEFAQESACQASLAKLRARLGAFR